MMKGAPTSVSLYESQLYSADSSSNVAVCVVQTWKKEQLWMDNSGSSMLCRVRTLLVICPACYVSSLMCFDLCSTLFRHLAPPLNAMQASVLENKLRQWVTKKIVEYLGEEEPTLRDFILTKIGERSKPQAIIEQLKVVLEDETELFVTKLWRALIYHTLESEYML